MTQINSDLLEQMNTSESKNIKESTQPTATFPSQKVKKIIEGNYCDAEQYRMLISEIIRNIDRQLYLLLPYEYYSMLKDENIGLSAEVATEIEHRILPIISKQIRLPLLNELDKEKVLMLIMNYFTKAMIKGNKVAIVSFT